MVVHGRLLCVPAASKLSLGLRKPHFRVPNPKIREFDGEVCNGRSGSGLGGKRCGDCGRESEKEGKEKCGLELEQAAVCEPENEANEEARSYQTYQTFANCTKMRRDTRRR